MKLTNAQKIIREYISKKKECRQPECFQFHHSDSYSDYYYSDYSDYGDYHDSY